HTRFSRDWSSDVCSSDLPPGIPPPWWAPKRRCFRRLPIIGGPVIGARLLPARTRRRQAPPSASGGRRERRADRVRRTGRRASPRAEERRVGEGGRVLGAV